jgi:hypothetical protein
MSLLRNFSPGGSEPDDDEPSTTAEPEETTPTDGRQPARYAFAAPAATADPVPGTVVESEVVPDSGRADEPGRTDEPYSAAEPDFAAEPRDAEEREFTDGTPSPVAEAPGPETARSPALETPVPEMSPTPTFQPNPAPVPVPRATDEDELVRRPVGGSERDFTGPDLTGPLLGDTAQLRARWQRVQGDFVDDPRAAVTAADDLIGQTAETLVEALRLRQRQMRAAWQRGPADSSPLAADGQPAAMAPGASDTEQLRLMMQRYRALFNELCRPS